MNMFNSDGQNYIAECWLPVDQLGTVQGIIEQATVRHCVTNVAKFTCSVIRRHLAYEHLLMMYRSNGSV